MSGPLYSAASLASSQSYDASSITNQPGNSASNPNAASNQQPTFVSGDILVGFSGEVVNSYQQRGLERAMQVAAGLVAPFGLTGGNTLFLAPAFAGQAARLVTHWSLPATADVMQVAGQLRGRPGVAYAEPNGIMTIQTHLDPAAPSDPGFTNPTGWPFGIQEHLLAPQINAEEAWDTTQGAGVVVAVVDTGVDLDHPDLNNSLRRDGSNNVIGGNFVSAAGAGSEAHAAAAGKGKPGGGGGGGGGSPTPPQDDNGHGTHVAGIIAAEINNRADMAYQATDPAWAGGTVGVAPQAKIMPVKVLNSGGSGSWADIAAGINYAANNGANIINMSLGGGFSDTVSAAILNAYTKGVLVISAAGNGNVEDSSHPAADPYSLSIAAVDKNDVRASFSNYGYSVDVAAPGVSILSTFIDVDDAGESGGLTGAYGRISGTSMATPAAAGVAALIWSHMAAAPTWNGLSATQKVQAVASQLLATADNIDAGNPGYIGKLGAGRVDALAALGTQVTAPVVTAVSGLGRDGETFNRLEVGRKIGVQFSHVMNASSVLNTSNYQLLYLGADGVLGGGDDQAVGLSMVSTSYDAFPGRGVELAIAGVVSGEPDGKYRFRVSGSGLGIDGDRNGTPGGDFITTFTLVPSPIEGFQPIEPFGSLVYQATVGGDFNSPGDIDRFTFDLDGSPEQVVSVRVNSAVASTISMTHSVLGPVSGAGTSRPLPAGTLTFEVAGATVGNYSIEVLLNAVRDAEPNNDAAHAQSLDNTFVTLASKSEFDKLDFTASRAAVIGSIGEFTSGSVLVPSGVVEGFETGSKSAYTEQSGGKNRGSNASVSTAAAHDGTYGLRDGANDGTGGWLYRASNLVQRGDIISVWVRADGNLTGRGYFGFGASSTGTLSIQMAPNTGELILGRHSSYTKYEDLAVVPQAWQANKWYRFEVEWRTNTDLTASGNNIVGRLYDSNGTTLLNTLEGFDNTIQSGGIAFRSFNSSLLDTSTKHFDTVTVGRNTTSADVYSFTLAAGQTANVMTTRLAGPAAAIAVSGDGGATWTSATSITASTAGGTYYVRVSGQSGSEYALQVLRSSVFDAAGNDSIANAQGLTEQVAVGAITSVFDANVDAIASFDSGDLTGYAQVAGSVDASISAQAAHDGPAGLESRTSNAWLYRDQAEVHVERGDLISVWVRSEGDPTGRAYFGFGASAAGTLSLVMAPNSNQFILQRNDNYGFADLDATPFTWEADHWYRMEATWSFDGRITGRLFDSDGSTLLATVRGADNQFESGGVAFRAIGSTKHFDTVQTGVATSDYYRIYLDAGESRTFSTLTPAGGPGNFFNTLNPALEVIGPSGSNVYSVVEGAGDEIVTFTADIAGEYIIRVFGESATIGEYILIDPPAANASLGGTAAALAMVGVAPLSGTGPTLAQLAPDLASQTFEALLTDLPVPRSRGFVPPARTTFSATAAVTTSNNLHLLDTARILKPADWDVEDFAGSHAADDSTAVDAAFATFDSRGWRKMAGDLALAAV